MNDGLASAVQFRTFAVFVGRRLPSHGHVMQCRLKELRMAGAATASASFDDEFGSDATSAATAAENTINVSVEDERNYSAFDVLGPPP